MISKYENMINIKFLGKLLLQLSICDSAAIEHSGPSYFLCISPQPHNTWVMSCVRCHELREQARAICCQSRGLAIEEQGQLGHHHSIHHQGMPRNINHLLTQEENVQGLLF